MGRRLSVLLALATFLVVPVAFCAAAPSASTIGAALRGREAPGDVLWDLPKWTPALQTLYGQHDDAPLWFRGRKPTRAALALLRELAAVEERGLNARDYDPYSLRELLGSIDQDPQPERIARADVAFSVVAARLASDLQRGRVRPAQVGYELDLHPDPFDAAQAVGDLSSGDDVASGLDALEPQLRHYTLLKAALARYREFARHPELTLLPALPKISVQPGAAYVGAASLRRLLVALGDLPPKDANPATPALLDAPTVKAIAQFQRRLGLKADGVLGRTTYRALTVPLDQRAQQIVLSLERLRWLPRTLEAPPIIVNIPQFRLFAFRTTQDAARDILQMDVIVGSTFKGRETPVFAADLRYVVLNPFWDVPYSIMRAELLPRIQAEPGWVEKNGYEIVAGPGDDAHAVPVTPENVAQLAAGKLRIRQLPGSANALGRIKFMFPNRHNVYLHDTPARALFNESRRAFSHGCIRVSDPLALLSHVLRDDPRWSAQQIEAALAGPPASRITLAHPIPVFIVYGTALATEAGDTLFFDDIYAQDARLTRLLSQRRR